MKYSDTTEEQRKSITPILREWFNALKPCGKIKTKMVWSKEVEYRCGVNNNLCSLCEINFDDTKMRIHAFQQAQKEEIRWLLSKFCGKEIETRVNKLKFESELE